MYFDSELALQNHCLSILKAKGIAAEAEVWVGGLRADIVTEDCVYELKKVLNRETLYQALGQAIAYNQTFKRKSIWIVGQSPSDPTEFQQASRIAEAISNQTVRVSFVDRDPFWNSEEASLANWLQMNLAMKLKLIVREFLWMLGIGIILSAIVVILVNAFWDNRVPVKSVPTVPELQ